MKQWQLSRIRWEELSKEGIYLIFQVEVMAAVVAETASSAQEFGGGWNREKYLNTWSSIYFRQGRKEGGRGGKTSESCCQQRGPGGAAIFLNLKWDKLWFKGWGGEDKVGDWAGKVEEKPGAGNCHHKVGCNLISLNEHAIISIIFCPLIIENSTTTSILLYRSGITFTFSNLVREDPAKKFRWI